MWGIRVRKENAEEMRKWLVARKLLNRSFEVVKYGNWVFFPLNRFVPGAIRFEFPKKEKKKSLKELFGIGSFDLIGNVAVIYIPEELWGKRREIGEALLKLYKGVTTVYARRGKVSGEFRVRPLELIAGVEREAVHKENGITLILDPRKVYFSPRQATERLRIARFIDNLRAKRVGVFFAGISPLAIYIERFARGVKEIFSIEKNFWACFYGIKSIEANKCKKIRVILGDVREVYRDLPPLDVLLMPLPKGSLDFLKEAFSVLREGGISVIYVASKEKEISEKLEKIKKYFRIFKVRKELQIGPREYRFVVYAGKGEGAMP